MKEKWIKLKRKKKQKKRKEKKMYATRNSTRRQLRSTSKFPKRRPHRNELRNIRDTRYKIETCLLDAIKQQRNKPIKGNEYFKKGTVSSEFITEFLKGRNDIIHSTSSKRKTTNSMIYLVKFNKYDKIGNTENWQERKRDYEKKGEDLENAKIFFWHIDLA